MAPNEDFLKNFICPNCHAALLELHPQEDLRDKNFVKCPICGFSKQISKEILEIHRIIYGK